MMRPLFAAAVIAGAIATAAPASAADVLINGNTDTGATFNRPLAGTPPTGLSGVGTAVSYQVTQFTVGTAGSYSFLMQGAFDTYLFLYSGSFNAAAPLANAITGNDDFGGSLVQSGFTSNLATGTNYFAVATGFSNSDRGAYTLAISGPGAINLVNGAIPEPGTWALLILGFGAIGGALRRRAAVSVSYA